MTRRDRARLLRQRAIERASQCSGRGGRARELAWLRRVGLDERSLAGFLVALVGTGIAAIAVADWLIPPRAAPRTLIIVVQPAPDSDEPAATRPLIGRPL